MSGLRPKQQADRAGRILQATTDLFRRGDSPAARIKDSAAATEVSVGTFRNDFDTKRCALLAIGTLDVEKVLSQGRTRRDDPPPDVTLARNRLMDGSLSTMRWSICQKRCDAPPRRLPTNLPAPRLPPATPGSTRCCPTRSAT